MEIGQLDVVKSLAGHDHGKVYIVIRSEGDYRWLVNGKERGLDYPKKKNVKHLQIIKCISKEMKERIQLANTDTQIKRIIKEIRNSMEDEDV